MIRLLTLFLLACLAACASKPQPDPLRDIVLVPQKQTVNVPKETLKECAPLPKLEDRAYTEGELPRALAPIVTASSECRARKRDLNKIVRDAFNISK